MPTLLRYALLADIAASLYMAGVIWTVQLVHYFLFDKVSAAGWATYHRLHSQQMSLVVLLPMVVQLGASCLLAWSPPGLPGVPRFVWLVGAALVVGTWVVTFFVSVPLHGKLGGAFDADACRALVQTNWIRTALWTAQAALMLYVVGRALEKAVK
ncbi:MAG: hypothetical protein H7Y38_13135 [Armatimonadetes bacterium]|nr:hypothetical protein [Armatimonadota bacterium]